MIAGVRRKRRDTWLRRVSSRVANGVRARLLRDDCPDSGCGLKLFRRDVFMRLPHFNHMHRFVPALVRAAGGSVLTLDVSHRPRERGESKYGLFDRLWVGVVDLFGVMWLQRRSSAVESREED
jgi:dolichol-phosphate mannosyltransferase